VNLHKLERVGSSVLGALMVAGGLKRRSIGGLAAVLTGSGLLYRGISGHCHVYQALGISTARRTLTDAVAEASRERRVQRTVTVDKPAAELYALWRDPATLRQVMAPFANLSPAADEGIRWSLRSPLGRLCVWTSQVVEEREGELLRWESIEGSKMIAGGMLRLAPALGNRGTRVSLSLRFEPPPGLIGHALFSTLRVVPNTISRKALQRFKSLAETGEIPTTEGSPSAIVRVTSTAICGSDVQPAGWMLSMIGVILIAVNRSRPKRCAIAVGKAQRVMRAIPTTSVELPLGSHGRSRG